VISRKNKTSKKAIQGTKPGHTEPYPRVGTSYQTSGMNIAFIKSEANIQISNNLPLWQIFAIQTN